jgi:hypothetical protein
VGAKFILDLQDAAMIYISRGHMVNQKCRKR